MRSGELFLMSGSGLSESTSTPTRAEPEGHAASEWAVHTGFMEISTGNVRHGGATGLVPVDVPKARHLPENVGPDKDRAQRGNWRGLTVEPEPPASHFTVADLTIRDVLVILKGAGCGAVVSGIVIGIWGAFGASLSPTAGAMILVLAAILRPQFVANILAYLGKVLTTVAGSLERSRLG
jgi:hypothetical protein